jgi:ribosomal protein S18 acetylase RimI-like enzyme
MDFDEALERTQWDLFWLPEGTHVVDRPEVLYLTNSRDEAYLNCVLRVRCPDAALPALVREVDTAHAHVSSRWMLYGADDRPALEAALAAAGYRPTHRHHGYVARAAEFRPRREARGIEVRRVETLADLRAAHEVSARGFGRAHTETNDDRRAELLKLLASDTRTDRFVAWDTATGAPVASAGLNVYPQLGFGYLWAGATVPEARGRGAYTALVAARVARALEKGCALVGLYARVDSSAPIVQAQGFTRCGPMVNWERPPRLW